MFVVGATFKIVDGISGLGEGFSCVSQLLFNFCSGADQQLIGSSRPRRQSTNATNHRSRFFNLVTFYIEHPR